MYKPESLRAQSLVHRAAKGHELRFDALHLRQGAHAVKHFLEQPAANRTLVLLGRDVHSANQTLVILQDIEGVADGGAAIESHAARQGVSVQETLNQFQRAAVVPMELIAPMVSLLMEEWLDLPNSRLAKVDDVHRSGVTGFDANAIIADSCQPLPNSQKGRYKSGT